MLSFSVRPAETEDASRIAYLCYLAGRGQVETSVYDLIVPGPHGPTDERLAVMEKMLTTTRRSWFHHSMYWVADIGGATAASLCAFNKEEGRTRPLLEAFREIGWSEDDLVAMGQRLEPFVRAEPRVPDEAWVIENVGCYERYRRRGLVRALLERAMEEGRERGYSHMQISVFIGNEPAISAYAGAGFEITEEKRSPEFARVFGCPGMYRMTYRA
jgi:ribosomal protein S18 acetylase RimI-like enzyme